MLNLYLKFESFLLYSIYFKTFSFLSCSVNFLCLINFLGSTVFIIIILLFTKIDWKYFLYSPKAQWKGTWVTDVRIRRIERPVIWSDGCWQNFIVKKSMEWAINITLHRAGLLLNGFIAGWQAANLPYWRLNYNSTWRSYINSFLYVKQTPFNFFSF